MREGEQDFFLGRLSVLRRGLSTELHGIDGNSTAGQNVLGHATQRVTDAHSEHALPEEALRGMKQLEAKVTVEKRQRQAMLWT